MTEMNITIDLDLDVPVFDQLVKQIKLAVQSGHLLPGDSLPSIRQLAGDLQLNNKTVAKAYRLLERDSVTVTRGYRGTSIHKDAVANSQIDLTAKVTETLKVVLQELRHVGATDSEIRIAFSQLMKTDFDNS